MRQIDAVLREVSESFRSGKVALPVLGSGVEAASAQELIDLGTLEGRMRYARILEPKFSALLDQARRRRRILVGALLGILAVALALAVWRSGDGLLAAGPIAGLGVTAAWPIRVLARLERAELRLSLLPHLLPLLSLDDQSTVVLRELEGRGD